jgi:hypothetical protein
LVRDHVFRLLRYDDIAQEFDLAVEEIVSHVVELEKCNPNFEDYGLVKSVKLYVRRIVEQTVSGQIVELSKGSNSTSNSTSNSNSTSTSNSNSSTNETAETTVLTFEDLYRRVTESEQFQSLGDEVLRNLKAAVLNVQDWFQQWDEHQSSSAVRGEDRKRRLDGEGDTGPCNPNVWGDFEAAMVQRASSSRNSPDGATDFFDPDVAAAVGMDPFADQVEGESGEDGGPSGDFFSMLNFDACPPYEELPNITESMGRAHAGADRLAALSSLKEFSILDLLYSEHWKSIRAALQMSLSDPMPAIRRESLQLLWSMFQQATPVQTGEIYISIVAHLHAWFRAAPPPPPETKQRNDECVRHILVVQAMQLEIPGLWLHYPDDIADKVLLGTFFLFCHDAGTPPSFVPQAAHFMAVIDPSAAWLKLWVLKAWCREQVLGFMYESGFVASALRIVRRHAAVGVEAPTQGGEGDSHTNAVHVKNTQQQVMEQALLLQSIVILASALSCAEGRACFRRGLHQCCHTTADGATSMRFETAETEGELSGNNRVRRLVNSGAAAATNAPTNASPTNVRTDAAVANVRTNIAPNTAKLSTAGVLALILQLFTRAPPTPPSASSSVPGSGSSDAAFVLCCKEAVWSLLSSSNDGSVFDTLSCDNLDTLLRPCREWEPKGGVDGVRIHDHAVCKEGAIVMRLLHVGQIMKALVTYIAEDAPSNERDCFYNDRLPHQEASTGRHHHRHVLYTPPRLCNSSYTSETAVRRLQKRNPHVVKTTTALQPPSRHQHHRYGIVTMSSPPCHCAIATPSPTPTPRHQNPNYQHHVNVQYSYKICTI